MKNRIPETPGIPKAKLSLSELMKCAETRQHPHDQSRSAEVVYVKPGAEHRIWDGIQIQSSENTIAISPNLVSYAGCEPIFTRHSMPRRISSNIQLTSSLYRLYPETVVVEDVLINGVWSCRLIVCDKTERARTTAPLRAYPQTMFMPDQKERPLPPDLIPALA